MNIWTRIKLWSERKERDAWLEKYGCDQKCHHCKTWQGNCGGWRDVRRNFPTPMHDTCTCGKCGQVSTLYDFGMGFMPVDAETLEPIK